MKIVVSVPLSPYSGYGRDGLGLTQALVRAGHDVYIQPTAAQPPLPQDVADLLTKPLQGPFDLGIVHLDPPAMTETAAGLRQSCTKLIGWTMWEYTSLHNAPKRSTYRKEWKNYDALVGYDSVTSEALKEYYSGPIVTVQGGYDTNGISYHERNWDDVIYFGMIGVLSNRKNPWAALAAFSELIYEQPELMKQARLLLKTSVPGLHPKIEDVFPGVRIVYDVWNDAQVREYYQNIHVLLAPSRGEGKNLPCLEAQTSGAPVIATNWGGHQEWLDESYAYPLDYDLIKVDIYNGKTPYWAQARVSHLKELIVHILENRAEAQEKGRLASLVIPALCNWDKRAAELLAALETVL